MNSKITILGNADSFWLQRFVDNVSVPLKQNVSIVSATNTKYSDYYSKNGIQVITTKPMKKGLLGSRFDAIRTTLNTVRAIKNQKPDIIHIHYAYPYILRIIPYIGKKRKTIVTFWGSDLLRANKAEIELINKTSREVDAFVVGAEDLYSRLIEINTELEHKTSLIRMGLTAFDNIDAKRESADDCRARLIGNQHEGKTIITVGYNAGRAQQHINVIRSLGKMPDTLKSKIVIVLPLTYQNEDNNYLEEIKQELGKAHITSVLLTEFMNDDQIAELCLATDVFINAQTTDAISASMLEHIYSGSEVLNAGWLSYRFLVENNINVNVFNSFDDIRILITKFVTERINTYDKSLAALIVKNNFSWSASRAKWQDVYEKFI